jgi:CheY-like chemotaxis protein
MPTILIVDDSAMDRCMVGGLVSKEADMAVDFANDGAEAIAAIRKRRPDLVITDLVMPAMNGLELVAAVRRDYPHVPVILMTSQGNEEIAVEALARGAASYVSKSQLATKLLETVHVVLAVANRMQSQARLERYLDRSARTFVLDNDPTLFGPLLACLQEEAARFRLWDETEQTRVGIALQEALSNALYHGNLELGAELREMDEGAYHSQAMLRRHQAPFAQRRIHLQAEYSHEVARFTVRDEGRGFDPRTLPDPTDPTNLERVCGRGVLLMRTFMDEVEFNAAGNVVTLRKRASCPAAV